MLSSNCDYKGTFKSVFSPLLHLPGGKTDHYCEGCPVCKLPTHTQIYRDTVLIKEAQQHVTTLMSLLHLPHTVQQLTSSVNVALPTMGVVNTALPDAGVSRLCLLRA